MVEAIPDFSDWEAAERWFREQPREKVVAMSSRAALRVLPQMVGVIAFGVENRRSTILAPYLRGISCSWTIFTFFVHEQEIPRTAAAAARTAAFAAALTAAAAVGTTSYNAAAAGDAARTAADAAAAAARTAADAARTAASRTAADAAAAAARTAAAAACTAADAIAAAAVLVAAPLWPGEGLPDRLNREWTSLKSRMRDADEGWEVWIDWYEARLRGDPPDLALERAKLEIPDEIWAQGPKVVNAEIARLIEARREELDAGKSAALELPAEADDAALGEPVYDPATNSYDLPPRAAEAPDFDDPAVLAAFRRDADLLGRACSELAEDIRTSEGNAPRAVATTLDRYAREVAKPPAEVSPDYLIHQCDRFRRTLGEEFAKDALGADFHGTLAALVTRHDALVGRFYPDVAARLGSIGAELADPNADIVQAAEQAAELPRLIAVEFPDWATLDPEAQARLDELKDEVKAHGFELIRLSESEKPAWRREMVRITKQIGGTSLKFFFKVGEGALARAC